MAGTKPAAAEERAQDSARGSPSIGAIVAEAAILALAGKRRISGKSRSGSRREFADTPRNIEPAPKPGSHTFLTTDAGAFDRQALGPASDGVRQETDTDHGEGQ